MRLGEREVATRFPPSAETIGFGEDAGGVWQGSGAGFWLRIQVFESSAYRWYLKPQIHRQSKRNWQPLRNDPSAKPALLRKTKVLSRWIVLQHRLPPSPGRTHVGHDGTSEGQAPGAASQAPP